MNTFVSLIQFDVAVIDLLWIFDLIQSVTLNFHQGTRAKLDRILTGCLTLASLGLTLDQNLILMVLLFLVMIFLTTWCVVYVFRDQMQLYQHRSNN